MKPLSELDPSHCTGLLFDIDDTLTSHGELKPNAYTALATLKAAGKACIAVTGRPAGWCDLIARLWPVDAVVGENGAFYMLKDAAQGKLRTVWAAPQADPIAHQTRLHAIARQIMQAVPGCALASDQAFRLCDLAIDFCEDVPALPLSAAQTIAALMQAQGMNAKISSIHVNGWFGEHDKLSTTLSLLEKHYAQSRQQALQSWVYVGDSPNDAPMFAAFKHSVGVVNVRAFGDLLATKPAYITPSDSGDGFAELVHHWLKFRG